MSDFDAALASSRRAFSRFTERCRSGVTAYRLTPASDESPYARCFGVFSRHLTGDLIEPLEQASLARAIRESARHTRGSGVDARGKGFRQLLAFSLSALAALGVLDDDPLEDLITEQISQDVARTLAEYGCLAGRPGSGNQAMFTAIFLIHGREHLGIDTAARIDDWLTLHLRAMNRFGFWGPDSGMTHLQFQNGYHQYEILEYLRAHNPRREESIAAVRSLSDAEGHFAPYPGGGGCYDYDAVFLLTPGGRVPDVETDRVLSRTAATLLAEQQSDGGFVESLYVRPRGRMQIKRMAAHVASGARNPRLFAERLRFALTLQRPKHERIQTHWSVYARRWDESDLWDSWFRMITLARIHAARDQSSAAGWGFIDYPGIGYHPSVSRGWQIDK